jgi:hypothetical protein
MILDVNGWARAFFFFLLRVLATRRVCGPDAATQLRRGRESGGLWVHTVVSWSERAVRYELCPAMMASVVRGTQSVGAGALDTAGRYQEADASLGRPIRARPPRSVSIARLACRGAPLFEAADTLR